MTYAHALLAEKLAWCALSTAGVIAALWVLLDCWRDVAAINFQRHERAYDPHLLYLVATAAIQRISLITLTHLLFLAIGVNSFFIPPPLPDAPDQAGARAILNVALIILANLVLVVKTWGEFYQRRRIMRYASRG